MCTGPRARGHGAGAAGQWRQRARSEPGALVTVVHRSFQRSPQGCDFVREMLLHMIYSVFLCCWMPGPRSTTSPPTARPPCMPVRGPSRAALFGCVCFVAPSHSSQDAASLLLKAGADFKLKNSDGQTPGMLAGTLPCVSAGSLTARSTGWAHRGRADVCGAHGQGDAGAVCQAQVALLCCVVCCVCVSSDHFASHVPVRGVP